MTDSSCKPTRDEEARKGGAGAEGAAKSQYMSRADRAKDQLSRIAGLFASKRLPDMLVKSYLEPTGSPSDKWSLGNRLIMTMEGTCDARGYRQWQSVGRHVKKGTKAIYILAPRLGKAVDKDEETGKETERTFVVGFTGVPVFRYEDTDGADLKTVKNAPKSLPPLVDVAKKWGIDVRFDATRHGEYGSFSKSDGEIRLCTDDVSTFFHELAHLAHSRIEDLKPGQDPGQEIIAQLVACTLARSYGYDVDGYTYGYIAHYASGDDPETVGRACYRVIGTAEKILDMILGGGGDNAKRSGRKGSRRGALIAAPAIERGGGSA